MTASLLAPLLTAVAVAAVGSRFRPRPARIGAQAPPGVRAPRRARVPTPRRRDQPDPAAVGAWCDRLARAVRSGLTLSVALRTAAPPSLAAHEVESIVLALDRGVPLDRAVAAVDAGDDLALALTVVRACAATGGPAAEPLDRAANALRARAAELADGRVQSAQARMSAAVMTILPLALLALLVATSAPVRGAVASPVGALVVLLGAALNLVGWRWMRRVIAGVSR